MSLYQRQEGIEINTDIGVAIIGCGGIGFHVSKMLAMSGVKNLWLFDDDEFEEHNFNRIDAPIEVIGYNKAEVAESMINQMRPDANVYAFPHKFRSGHLNYDNIDWIIDCTDVHAVQVENQKIAEENGVKYVKAGYDGTSISINDAVALWDTGETPDGYQITPSWVVPAVVVAALTVGKVLKWHTKELGCDVSKLYSEAV